MNSISIEKHGHFKVDITLNQKNKITTKNVSKYKFIGRLFYKFGYASKLTIIFNDRPKTIYINTNSFINHVKEIKSHFFNTKYLNSKNLKKINLQTLEKIFKQKNVMPTSPRTSNEKSSAAIAEISERNEANNIDDSNKDTADKQSPKSMEISNSTQIAPAVHVVPAVPVAPAVPVETLNPEPEFQLVPFSPSENQEITKEGISKINSKKLVAPSKFFEELSKLIPDGAFGIGSSIFTTNFTDSNGSIFYQSLKIETILLKDGTSAKKESISKPSSKMYDFVYVPFRLQKGDQLIQMGNLPEEANFDAIIEIQTDPSQNYPLPRIKNPVTIEEL